MPKDTLPSIGSMVLKLVLSHTYEGAATDRKSVVAAPSGFIFSIYNTAQKAALPTYSTTTS